MEQFSDFFLLALTNTVVLLFGFKILLFPTYFRMRLAGNNGLATCFWSFLPIKKSHWPCFPVFVLTDANGQVCCGRDMGLSLPV